jgi:hypothetical protein
VRLFAATFLSWHSVWRRFWGGCSATVRWEQCIGGGLGERERLARRPGRREGSLAECGAGADHRAVIYGAVLGARKFASR